MIRVILPFHLQSLAACPREITVSVEPPVTLSAIIDAIEARYPALRGTIREHGASKRRPLVRFFACEMDLSHEPMETPVPDAVATGREPFIVLGAIAGG